ncbi:uncharacterized protein BCR38DRAFT_416396 [Pseudomassariella vexata]|uniref:Secreted protein n=1 Tax=Pseudomassariella vexata TaxID=1141098 RepID=A0A1Y2EIA3_9PEZI|nr:uncharacterized protein BCR38DRAFT_416396 [Pseudomassariella vexata]ORY71293.1 hypothetical protein BCR38DRAFT_416396 [Pseudomassariella vexata]
MLRVKRVTMLCWLALRLRTTTSSCPTLTSMKMTLWSSPWIHQATTATRIILSTGIACRRASLLACAAPTTPKSTGFRTPNQLYSVEFPLPDRFCFSVLVICNNHQRGGIENGLIEKRSRPPLSPLTQGWMSV